MHRLRFTALAALLLPLIGLQARTAKAAAPVAKPVVAGYLPDYRVGSVSADTIAQNYTDICLFSAEVGPNGELKTDLLKAGLGLVPDLKKAGVRVWMTVGGWERSAGFPAVAADSSKRTGFAQALATFCEAHGLAGADLDWEHPEGPRQDAEYGALLIEVKRVFAPKGLLLSAAIATGQNLPASAIAKMDRVNLMAYDADGQHATSAFAQQAVTAALASGIPASKLCLGLPFYGRSVKDRKLAKTYDELAAGLTDPNADQIGDFYFNGKGTLTKKAAYARDNHLAGVFAWEIGQNPGGELIQAVKRGLTGSK